MQARGSQLCLKIAGQRHSLNALHQQRHVFCSLQGSTFCAHGVLVPVSVTLRGGSPRSSSVSKAAASTGTHVPSICRRKRRKLTFTLCPDSTVETTEVQCRHHFLHLIRESNPLS